MIVRRRAAWLALPVLLWLGAWSGRGVDGATRRQLLADSDSGSDTTWDDSALAWYSARANTSLPAVGDKCANRIEAQPEFLSCMQFAPGCTFLSLGMKGLSCTIPSEIGLLSALTWLNLRDNSLTGALPTEMGMLTSLTGLLAGSQCLNGPLPTELGTMSRLNLLDVPEACLTGAVPSELGLLRGEEGRDTDSDNDGLSVVVLWGNYLTGSIPSEMALLPLDVFDVDNNTALSGCNPLPFNTTDVMDTNVTGPCAASAAYAASLRLTSNTSALRTTSPSDDPQAASAAEAPLRTQLAGVGGDTSSWTGDATQPLFLTACVAVVALVGAASYRSRRAAAAAVAAAAPHDESLTKLMRPFDTSACRTYSTSAAAVPTCVDDLQMLEVETGGGGASKHDCSEVRACREAPRGWSVQ